MRLCSRLRKKNLRNFHFGTAMANATNFLNVRCSLCERIFSDFHQCTRTALRLSKIFIFSLWKTVCDIGTNLVFFNLAYQNALQSPKTVF